MPRFLTEAQSAEALGMPLSNFRHWVTIGRLPSPVDDLQLYDIRALHAACDRAAGIGCAGDALDAWLDRKDARQ